MRIIAGRYKGRRLRAVEDRAVRSTGDRVRESLFNILAAEIPGADVLDLFCGAGTLGLEALSRGVRHVTFVDKSRRSVRRTRDNTDLLDAAASVEIITADAMAAMRALKREGLRFSLIFADPPYGEATARANDASRAVISSTSGSPTSTFRPSARSPMIHETRLSVSETKSPFAGRLLQSIVGGKPTMTTRPRSSAVRLRTRRGGPGSRC